MDKFNFGDKLIYTSPQKSDLRTPCIFLRDDNERAVVMFSHAEWAARVNYSCLSRDGEMLLVDMELPSGCDVCPCCQPDAHFNLYTCGITEEDVMDDETGEILQERPLGCPIQVCH